ncbi:chromate resistance protein [Aquabacterium sp. A7-Y]|uniref:chromate resistance protein ChrB domain-containing protein n=1 Tax=Aquabacterium sp. A7-Y TaxID=1349605 RepID=UPI00223D5108|nr:chromate resistance protein ChrB domain-containing protein [Aquabacterium sp. A7-Y]MCW7541387.1 chromate resistance protein [Aquabacterium sp. A7-Y]
MNSRGAASWLLFVVSLPTKSATARMRVWRALKAAGCAALRDGAYLLPGDATRQEALRQLGEECRNEGGNAWLLAVQPLHSDEEAVFRQLFDRTEDYQTLRRSWKDATATLSGLAAAELLRLQRKLQREYDALRSIDFFPGEGSVEAQAAWAELCARISRLLSPDEPNDTSGAVPRLQATAYQGRTWATRRRPWVDRVASAWLIRRFIDPHARFEWLEQPSDCPKEALGFDFDGAAFTHVGERVTFETLMAAFGLEGDAALMRLAALVHVLDVGGEPVPEAAGFEAVMGGARERVADDDALLDEMSQVLDSLYAHFEGQGARTGS